MVLKRKIVVRRKKYKGEIPKSVTRTVAKKNVIVFSERDVQLMISKFVLNNNTTKEEIDLLDRLEETVEIMKFTRALNGDKIIAQVKYTSLMGWLDNLTSGMIYPVVEENTRKSTYTIINDIWEKKEYSIHKFSKR